ncbi:hypothetical protein FM042_06780 [Aliidiomarina halalkaliphila]|uniref:Uncharacterized protein n=1 Tax=Aliidiomarina halalkaliphila TaxID=2593535 RepID=A0A552X143_9GAMM|nr:hypothetical protein [Aliidiomarina halalkaliphila]TRW48685.1 hypothetical protein FM042_06780 [Aliidiomarina halalkaliphila]
MNNPWPVYQTITRLVAGACIALALSACQTTNVNSVGPNATGPGGTTITGTQNRTYNYPSDVYLSVAIPVFDPGLPMDSQGNLDYGKVHDLDIWPQVRRLEANRFAVDTKRALAETNAFSNLSVTPDANASADVYVLGTINHSDTETLNLTVQVRDATNHLWGERTFEYRVHEGFYRDAFNQGKNPYDPMFKTIASYVYDLLLDRTDEQKLTIQRVGQLRYAAMYSPESMAPYINERSTRNGNRYTLNGFPAENDPMFQRIQVIQAEDQAFIDNLQTNYDAFYAESDSSYLDYHQETLPIAAEIRREKARRASQQITAVLAAVGTALLIRNSDSTAGEVGAYVLGATSLYNLSGAVESNRNLRFQRQQLSEMGQSLDIKVTPQVVEFNNQRIELQGSAREQYTQLRAQLQAIHAIESTPDQQL